MKDDFNDPANGPKTQMVNWVWKLYQSDGVTPVMHDGDQVEYVSETSSATGRRSKAAGYFSAHLKRPFTGGDLDTVMQECIGKKVMLIITEKDSGWKNTDVFQSGV